MNCLGFRREKLADPRRLSDEARAHVRACHDCAVFACEVDETETEVDRALQVPVPEGLADRIIFHSRKPRAAWRGWALAAVLVLGVGVGVAPMVKHLPTGVQPHALGAIEHVEMDPKALVTIRNADGAAFAAVVERFGGTIRGPIGRIRYVTPCPVPGSPDWHVVFETPQGVATLVLVPSRTPRAVEVAALRGWHSLVRPTRFGYYAIITESAQATSEADRLLREKVDWNSKAPQA